jgi:hypothetical protein
MQIKQRMRAVLKLKILLKLLVKLLKFFPKVLSKQSGNKVIAISGYNTNTNFGRLKQEGTMFSAE